MADGGVVVLTGNQIFRREFHEIGIQSDGSLAVNFCVDVLREVKQTFPTATRTPFPRPLLKLSFALLRDDTPRSYHMSSSLIRNRMNDELARVLRESLAEDYQIRSNVTEALKKVEQSRRVRPDAP